MSKQIIKVPSTLRDIKLKEWQRFQEVLDNNKDNDNNDFLELKMLQIFCGMDLKSVKNIKLSAFEEIIEHINVIFSSKNKRINSFKLRGVDGVEVEFGLIPNLDDMSYGEFTDLENYIYDKKNAHRAMAVLYRPIQYRKGDTYHIQRYKGSEHLSEIMKDAPLDVYLGVQVFFYNLARKLGDYTMDYTLNQLSQVVEEESESLLEKNGEAIRQSMNSHKEILQSLKRLHKLTSINH